MRGGVLDRLLASEDASQVEMLGAAARETLEEALGSGSAEDVAKFWPDVLKVRVVVACVLRHGSF